MSYNTYTTYTANGATTDFAIPFPYDDVSEIKVFAGANPVTFTLVNPGLLRLPNAPTNGTVITIRRKTDLATPVVQFIEGKNVLGGPANKQVTQLLRGLQETIDTQAGQGTQGPPGVAGPSGPAANFLLFNTVEAVTLTNIPSAGLGGPDYIRTAGYYSVGDGGEAIYKRVSSGSTTRYRFQSADGQRWELAMQDFNIKQFGAVANDVADDYPAFAAAFEFLATFDTPGGYYGATPKLHVSFGKYYCSQTWILTDATYNIEGDGNGFQASHNAAIIRWPAGVGGIRVERYNTENGEFVTPGRAADGTIIKGLLIKGGGYHATNKVDGIALKARAVVEDCKIMSFSRDGINIDAYAGVGPTEGELEGNANCFQLNRLLLLGNDRHGVFVRGADANAGVGISLDCTGNRGWGICDRSFLGNTWINCHTDYNGLYGSGAGGPVSTAMVSHGGVGYVAAPNRTHAEYASTTPGTDATVWRVNPDAVLPSWHYPAWGTADLLYHEGGSYHSQGANSRCTWVGCYAEGGQAPSSIGGYCVNIGGAQGAGDLNDDGLAIRIYDGKISNFTLLPHPNDTDPAVVTFRRGNNTIMSMSKENLSYDLTYFSDTKSWAWGWVGYGSSNQSQHITDWNTPIQCGTGASIGPYKNILPHGLYIGGGVGAGNPQNARLVMVSDGPPTSGAHARGEVAFNSFAAAGGPMGWTCVEAGTPGVWKAMPNLAA